MATPDRPSLRQNVRAMPGTAWVLFAGSFVNRLGTFVLPFLTLYLTAERDYSAPQAGVAIAAYGLGGLLAQVFGGLVADRLGRRNAIAASMFSAAVSTLALWRATSLATIYPLMFALGASAELYRPAAGALIADLLPSEQRVTAFTLYRLAVNVGWAVGLALGGFVLERSADLLFLADAATSAGFGVISLVALPHGTRTTKREEAHLPTARRSIAGDRGFLVFLVAVLLAATVYAQNASTFPLHLRDAGHPPSTYGLLQAMNGLLVVAFELPVIAWTQRHRKLSMVALGHLLIGLGFFTLLVAEQIPALVAMILIWTLGEMIESPVAATVAADRAPLHARGRYQAAYGAMFGVAWMLGPVLGTSLYAISPDAVWIGCGIAGVIAATLALAARRLPAPVLEGPTPAADAVGV
ncbi:MAG TPA: MFS transporter [Actinomycetota bacterium]|nr:MFS transporter [Actinomycetota bacterium]